MVCVNKLKVCIMNKNISSRTTKVFSSCLNSWVFIKADSLALLSRISTKSVWSRTNNNSPDRQTAGSVFALQRCETVYFLLSFSAETVMFKNIKFNTGGPTNLMFLQNYFYITTVLRIVKILKQQQSRTKSDSGWTQAVVSFRLWLSRSTGPRTRRENVINDDWK